MKSSALTARNLLAALLGGLLIAFFGFNAGGYFPDSAGAAAVALAACLVGWILVARRPFDGWGPAATVAAAAIGLLCAWTLASSLWSDAPFRAAVEFDRSLLYLLAFLLGAAVPFSEGRLRWVLRVLVAGAVAVCLAGFLSRVGPGLFSVPHNLDEARLSFPISYWNGLGLLAGIALLFSLALSSDPAENRFVRAVAAGVTPLLAATLILTFSRGAAAATIIGLLVLAIAGRGPALLATLLSVGPFVVVGVLAALNADLLAEDRHFSPAAIDQGHDLALIILAVGVGAACLRFLARPLEARLPQRVPRAVTVSLAVATVGIVAGIVLLANVPQLVHEAGKRFEEDAPVAPSEQRERLTDLGNNGRLDHWRVAIDGFDAAPVRGSGAGTYELLWNRHRSETATHVRDAHSLYLENLAELGIVGGLLLASALVALMVGIARRARGPSRALAGGLLAAAVAWALEAAIDWSWELPAVTAWLFFAGGVTLARGWEPSAEARPRAGWAGRVVAVAAMAALAIVPARVAISEVRLDQGLDAFEREDCPQAIDSSLASLAAFDDRPEPFALMGYCDARLGRAPLGVEMLERASARDPEEWDYQYGLAVVRAAAGLDPRRAAARARELSPAEPEVLLANDLFSTNSQASWRRSASRLPYPEH